MSRTITAECHGVSRVSHPHSACASGTHAESGLHPVSAAFARLLPGPYSRGTSNSRRSDGAPPICHRIAEPPGDAPIPHGQNSTARPRVIFGASLSLWDHLRWYLALGGFTP